MGSYDTSKKVLCAPQAQPNKNNAIPNLERKLAIKKRSARERLKRKTVL